MSLIVFICLIGLKATCRNTKTFDDKSYREFEEKGKQLTNEQIPRGDLQLNDVFQISDENLGFQTSITQVQFISDVLVIH